jgi:Stress responsive A/B Barrel Domain
MVAMEDGLGNCFARVSTHKLNVIIENRRSSVPSIKQLGLQFALCAGLFGVGTVVGSLYATKVSAQNKFGQPKTVLHVVVYKFKDATSENDRQKALDGIKDLGRKIPGVKNIWLKTNRNQIRDFSGVYAIEFTSAEAAADYAESPAHEAWAKQWEALRENSLSFQVTNP